MGLIRLFLDEPEIAEQWFNIRDKASGRRFFRDTQPKVREALKQFELDGTYEIASGGSQHVRLAGIVRSVAGTGGELRLPDQDVDPDAAFNFHLTVAHFHKIQGPIVAAMGRLVPEVANEGWAKLFNPFATRINELWTTLERRYPDDTADSGAEPAEA